MSGKTRILALTLAALAAVPTAALATNGMYLVGYGPETVARGGANLAIADRTLALNFNPAGIAQLQGNHLSASLSVLAPSLTFGNMVNDTTDAETAYFPLPAVAYVRAGNDTPWAWGIGLVAQGGMGAELRDLNTFFGTRDDTFSEVRYATITPTVAYSINEDMAVGATLNVGWADAAFKFFPHTSFFNTQDPANSFFGVDLDKAAGGLQTSARVGWWWRPRPRFSVGAIYQTKTNSTFDGGEMVVNFDAHPFLGRRVRYTSTEIDGFTFAAQAGVGVAFRPNDRWVLAVDVKRYFWDDAIDTITVTARDPEVTGAPSEVVLPFVFNWQDQWVLAIGGDYRWSDRLTLRAGYNYGENPVPDVTLTPLFPATTEHHVTFGFGWLAGNRLFELGVERAFNSDQTNNNLDPRVNPFGPGARVEHQQWTVSLGVSWAWDRG